VDVNPEIANLDNVYELKQCFKLLAE